jgi:hypothetical protein
MVDRLGEQFARHKSFLETGGTQACEQVEMFEVRGLADEGVQVACNRHPAHPGASDGKILQEREEFKRMSAVGRDAILVGSFGRVQLSVATDDDLTVASLPLIEMAGEPLAPVMGEFEWRLLVALGMGVPVEVRHECSNAQKAVTGSRSSSRVVFGVVLATWYIRTEDVMHRNYGKLCSPRLVTKSKASAPATVAMRLSIAAQRGR